MFLRLICFTFVLLLIGSEAHKAFFEAMDDELDQAPCYRFMIPVFGKGVVYDAPLRKKKTTNALLGGSLRPTELKRYPGIIAKEAYDFFKKFCIKSEQAMVGTPFVADDGRFNNINSKCNVTWPRSTEAFI